MAALAQDVRELTQLARREAETARLQRSLSLVTGLATGISGLEIAYEHYKGSYGTQIMWTPVLLSPALMAAGIWGALSPRAARTVLPWVAGITVADGCTGFIFHIRGVHRKPGGWHLIMPNVPMGPPLFAPLLLAATAYLGVLASRMQPEEGHAVAPEKAERLRRHLVLLTTVSSVCSGLEASYSHYQNNFQYWVQWTPITLSPALAAAALATLRRRPTRPKLLPVLSALAIVDGAAGFFFHARGVLRRPGGGKHLVYNILYGPPVLAPLLFAACGFFGLLATFVGRKR